jgi:hypothetical protein
MKDDKADFTKRLHESPKYKRALELARNDDERRRIATLTNRFVESFAEILAPVIDRAKNDPEFAQQLGQALKERQSVVTSEPATSGSTGDNG